MIFVRRTGRAIPPLACRSAADKTSVSGKVQVAVGPSPLRRLQCLLRARSTGLTAVRACSALDRGYRAG